VAGITYLGERDYSLRAWLDPDKLAALDLSAMDVVTAIAQQNIQVAAGQIGQQPVPRGQQFQLTISTLGRLTDPDQFADIIVKSGTTGSPNQSQASSGASASTDQTSQNSTSTALTASSQTGPVPQSAGIVRLRDVVRQNRFAVRLRFDPVKLAAHGLTASAITAGLKTQVLGVSSEAGNQASGTEPAAWIAWFGGQQPPVLEQLADLKIQVPGLKEPVRLGDVVAGKDGMERLLEQDELGVQLGAQQYDQSCTFNGQPSVALSIFQSPGSNALDTAAGVYAKMEDLKTRFPEGLAYRIVYDTTPFIRASVNEVFYTLRDAVILVAIVVLVFLQDWKAMILPMIDVPVSLIGTFAVMAIMGFTLNNLTLFGLVLAIGIVVDDAIVVLENIERLIATGLDARTATIKAMEQITGPVLAITLVLSSVFIPCCFLGGISGQFFRQFAVTIAVSTIISAVNAITMTPSRAVLIFKTEETGAGHEPVREALPWWIFAVLGGLLTIWLGNTLQESKALPSLPTPTSRLLSWTMSGLFFVPGAIVGGALGWFIIRPVNAVLGWLFRGFNRLFDRAIGVYGRTVARSLRISAMVLIIYCGLLALTYVQFSRAPTGFIPQQDKGYLILNVQLPDSASLERTERIMARIETLAHDVPGVENTVGVSGQSLILNANAPNLGSLYVMFADFSKRHGPALSADGIAAALTERCRREIRAAVVTAFGAPPIDGLGTTGGYKIVLQDRGNLGVDELQRVSLQVVERGNKTPGLQGLFSSSGANTPWLYLDIDRTKAMALGVQVSDVFNALQVYVGSFYVNNFNEFGRTWQVIVQAAPGFRSDISDIRLLQVRNTQGQMIRLGTLLEVRDISGPVMVMRYNLYSAAAITGNAAPGHSSGEAIDLMEQIVSREAPPSMAYEWTELALLQLEIGNTPLYLFALAAIFVFLVLAAQYESWVLPLAVILVVPMCLFSSVIGVQLAGMEITIFTQIGFIVLVGLASKNAILIVEFAKRQREQGKPTTEAILDACRLRLRPILMTSFAFIFGVVPLVVAHGAGAEMRQSLGTAVFSGMIGVTLFGIFLTPVFFFSLQRFLDRRAEERPV
jgi:multidrug efflux pump subunit AcrB